METVPNSCPTELRKRNLRMFKGIINSEYEEDVPQVESEREWPKISPYLEESNLDTSMKRFEDFSSVWRDETSADSFHFGRADTSFVRGEKSNYSQRNKANKKDSEFVIEKQRWTKSNENEENSLKVEECTMRLDQKNPKYSSEMKRRIALEEKWNSIEERKNLIRNALKNINSKKIDSEEQCQTKMTLFNEDSTDEETFEPNFEVKSYLEGDTGLKRLNLKAKLASDERFKIDERFFDGDEIDVTNCNPSKKSQSMPGLMKRYDPSQPISQKSSKSHATQIEKKKSKMKKKRIEETNELMETVKPLVSKEKHYSVSANLKEAFNRNCEDVSFSLSAMFDAQLEKSKRRSSEEELVSIMPIKNLKFVEKRIENDEISEVEDNDGEEKDGEEEGGTPLDALKLASTSEKVLGKCGVWGETFFFKPNDSRLKEAASFFQSFDPSEKRDFCTRRKELRSIVKKKIQNSRRDEKIFKRKLGGKINRTKFRVRLNRAKL